MLIEFRVANFRSIKETQTLSLVAGAGKELTVENSFDSGLVGFPRLLRSAVIYGANAAGKSNLLKALHCMQGLVLTSAAVSATGARITHTPFRLSEASKDQPSQFEVVFADNGVRYEYGFTVDADKFHSEWLIAYPHGRPQRWFDREYVKDKQEYKWDFGSKLKGSPSVWRDATRVNALFLSTAIQLNSKQLQPVFKWFQKRLAVIDNQSVHLNQALTYKLLEEAQGKDSLLRFVRAADLGISDLALRREPMIPGKRLMGNIVLDNPTEGQVPTVLRVSSFHKSIDSDNSVAFEMQEESNGTQKLFDTAGAWLNVLEKGEVLLVDELDTSLHPLMTRFLVGMFHGQSSNLNNAQLIFTTHDTSLLDAEIFRRDQVWFVEKDKGSASRVYSLSDFSPRKTEALERGYLKGRYGALPFIGDLKL